MGYLLFFAMPILALAFTYSALLPFRRRFHSNGMKGKLVIEPGDVAVRLFTLSMAAILFWVWSETF